MTTYNHTHPGSSTPFARPGRARPATSSVAWRDMLAILAAAAFVIAVFFALFNMAGAASVPSTVVHHGGAHGRAGILFRQQLSGPMRATESGIARKGSFGRAHWLQAVGGGVVASTAAISGEQLSGPMTLEKQRLARHDDGRYGITTMNWGGVASAEGAWTHKSYTWPSRHPATGGRTVSHMLQSSTAA
jgi:hypothetical protein